MNTLRTTLIQTHLHWEDPTANRAHFESLIKQMDKKTDLIVLPEMFTTGFTMNAKGMAEATNGPTLLWLQAIAKKHRCAITGSIIVKDNGLYYNRLYFVRPDGSYGQYDKKHTFTLAGEHKTYTAGRVKTTINYKGWKICPLICYDLRFPVWARNTEGYHLLLYVANWPKKRIHAWDVLLKARAIENMSYCIGVNRTGIDDNGHEYPGHSAGYDVLGKKLTASHGKSAFVETLPLSKDHIGQHRERLQFLKDRDTFTLT